MKRFELLIFDWDGTLVDSAAQIVGAMQGTIRALDLPPRRDEEIRQLIGLGLNDVLQILYPDMDLLKLRALLEGYRARWLNGGGSEAPLFPGVHEALNELHGNGYQLAIATGKSRAGLTRSLDHHASLRSLISSSRCSDETASKPHPLMLQEILEDELLAPQRALMIGDTEYDMEMARAIGMPALGVVCGVHEPERLLKAGALALVEDVSRVPEWLKQFAAQGSVQPA